MSDSINEITPDFWNIRGSFRKLGVLNIGTQSSLARLTSGRFVLLDSYTLSGEVADRVMELTDGGSKLEAVINLHPFHTVHVGAVAEMFPNARYYGTSRHHSKNPEISWAPASTESPEFAALYRDDFEFLVPRGVSFVSRNESLHFASVLAIHRASKTLHVDDTLNWVPFPWGGALRFHPTLAGVLERRVGAASDFRAWANELADACEDVSTVCAAHLNAGKLRGEKPGVVAGQVRDALKATEKTLREHEARFPSH